MHEEFVTHINKANLPVIVNHSERKGSGSQETKYPTAPQYMESHYNRN